MFCMIAAVFVKFANTIRYLKSCPRPIYKMHFHWSSLIQPTNQHIRCSGCHRSCFITKENIISPGFGWFLSNSRQDICLFIQFSLEILSLSWSLFAHKNMKIKFDYISWISSVLHIIMPLHGEKQNRDIHVF